MDTFEALADPTRRSIIEMLAAEDMNAGEIAASFPVSRPAVSRHLRVLRETGLVSVKERAQQRVYRLEPDRFAEVEQWLARYTRFWANRLDRLVTLLDETTEEQ